VTGLSFPTISDIQDEAVATEVAARVAAEAAITAEAMVQIASLAATTVVTKATQTAEAAMDVAAVAAADIVADAEDVAEAMIVAAAAAAAAAQRVRRTVAGAISAEAAAKRAMAESAEKLSEELTRRIEIEARMVAQERELTAFAGMVAHDLKAPLTSVHADPTLCRQLLDNLIGNALKYTPPGTAAHVFISSHEADGMIRIDIVDHGVGVPPGQHELIFSPLHRSHAGYDGTGLGLAICERIVNRHGGVIGVTDNPGGGSHFHFTLPARNSTELSSV
jgi:signal transduction histidine kinase